jgi:hypothetical protein
MFNTLKNTVGDWLLWSFGSISTIQVETRPDTRVVTTDGGQELIQFETLEHLRKDILNVKKILVHLPRLTREKTLVSSVSEIDFRSIETTVKILWKRAHSDTQRRDVIKCRQKLELMTREIVFALQDVCKESKQEQQFKKNGKNITVFYSSSDIDLLLRQISCQPDTPLKMESI